MARMSVAAHLPMLHVGSWKASMPVHVPRAGKPAHSGIFCASLVAMMLTDRDIGLGIMARSMLIEARPLPSWPCSVYPSPVQEA